MTEMIKMRQSCPLGLTDDDLNVILGQQRGEFNKWMTGQTVSSCTGQLYDHGLMRYVDNSHPGSPHGIVTYRSDVERFLHGLPVID